MAGYDYFDEDYFNNGPSKGTVYSDYVAASRKSLAYSEIARIIIEVFKPKSVLEIGCATGIIVRKLNECGISAHGVDVSQWAIDHREHEHVVLAGAEDLPFRDGMFDLVFSVHALEHVPRDLGSRAFKEMRRVSNNGIHWHMLPMIGRGPYIGQRENVVAGLSRDPTHNIIEDAEWWRGQFAQFGLHDTYLSIYVGCEQQNIDLGDSHLILSVDGLPVDTRASIRDWNYRVLMSHLRKSAMSSPVLSLSDDWADLRFDPIVGPIPPQAWVTANITASYDAILRFAILDPDSGFEADKWIELKKGHNKCSFTVSEMVTRAGRSGLSLRNSYLLFGGIGSGLTSVSMSVSDGIATYFST